ncbi:4-hydroxythreonine-4-phosphate dehydrogenase PdxA [Candidatus Sulfidibacterium hydrothermale]|uniref:4-hydroxythreonine-4-phosphate dehydrogenase PdxA n=1 Tax=Candidatus Sulfidibacterium hydrothermale TaxID=2875962 RepID=UPI001F0AA1D1|nr:4-hydroxythreonine-4-phosphate dehydrogenase PdxA [Candidatus Sulfidibacterium hydrothermale]UBM63330.1 4-hydroxythreonine-4-phosphate dehydrogenase PdxA [Candidatus Sulfidibacterium hydrothermale]
MKERLKEKNRPVRVGVTHGDFNGISYEIMIKALMDNRLYEMFTPVIYGLPRVIGYHRKQLRLTDLNYHVISNSSKIIDRKLNILSLSDEEIKIEFGKSTPLAGQFAYQALETAVKDIKNKKIDVLVTAPINKENIHSQDFSFQGHTEYLTNRFQVEDSLMLMVSDSLRVGTVTNHLPVKEVAQNITEEKLLSKLNILHESLKKDFLIERPKIAVLGLNPHAGDNGVIGTEDETIIHSTLIKVKKQGMLVFGPFAADGFFGSGKYTQFDAVLAMYHDQGLIPFKLLAENGGVNYTAGLPIVRTSPDHGTAYDIAGKNLASPASMRQAVYLAINIFRNRRQWEAMHAHPLSEQS